MKKRKIKNKFNFLLFLLKIFKNSSFFTKIYLYLRILIFPNKFLDIIPNLLTKKNRILDLGCGYGIVSLYLKYLGINNYIFGLDIDKKRIHNLKNIVKKFGFKNLHFDIKDFIKEGFDGFESYDTAILVDFLHHLDFNTQKLLLKNLSKHISTLIIKEIDIKPKYKYYWNLFHDKILMQNKILCFQGSDFFIEFLTDLGYTVIYQKIPSFFPYPHYLLVAKK